MIIKKFIMSFKNPIYFFSYLSVSFFFTVLSLYPCLLLAFLSSIYWHQSQLMNEYRNYINRTDFSNPYVKIKFHNISLSNFSIMTCLLLWSTSLYSNFYLYDYVPVKGLNIVIQSLIWITLSAIGLYYFNKIGLKFNNFSNENLSINKIICNEFMDLINNHRFFKKVTEVHYDYSNNQLYFSHCNLKIYFKNSIINGKIIETSEILKHYSVINNDVINWTSSDIDLLEMYLT